MGYQLTNQTSRNCQQAATFIAMQSTDCQSSLGDSRRLGYNSCPIAMQQTQLDSTDYVSEFALAVGESSSM
jgi:hypothetical protein